ncbi:Hypothetical predicted protein [Cloeon dipterum]|uniref:Cullin family profile domain-containing protein n=2 Tax=Cloeon dipterum TaxID=197152 RepID=A0A8S1DJJ5_9INSE|nr:Hypothetical predicted protein [Cloeon dipterum]
MKPVLMLFQRFRAHLPTLFDSFLPPPAIGQPLCVLTSREIYKMENTTNQSNFEDIWALIEPDVLTILLSKKSVASNRLKHSMNSTIRKILRKCDQEFIEFIYEKAVDVLLDHVRNIMTSFCGMENDCCLFVSNFNKQWALFKKTCNKLAQLHKPTEGLFFKWGCYWSMGIHNIGLIAWHDAMTKEDFQEYLMSALMDLVHKIRRGEQNKEILNDMTQALENLSVIYSTEFLNEPGDITYEDLLLEELFEPVMQTYDEIEDIYSEINELDDALRIMENIVKLCRMDKVWIEAVFAEDVANSFSSDILEAYFEPLKPTILRNLDRLFEEDRHEALSSLYFIFKYINDGVDMEKLTSKFDSIVQSETNEIASKSAGTDQVVEALAKLYSKMCNMIKTIFRGDITFLDMLKKTVAPILNQKTGPNSPCTSPEILAKLLDNLMRKEDLAESEIMEELDRIGPAYQILLEKDFFERFHILLTAKRLRQKIHRSLKLEEGLLQRLPEWEMGDLTLRCNIKAMIEDVQISNKVLERFNTMKNGFGYVFTAQVMKSQAWPIHSTDNTKIELSGELKVALDKYESIHNHFYNDRKLIWNYLHSTGEIQINYSNKPYLLSMNTYQMAIMLLFEKNNHLGFTDIKETLTIPEETLVDQLACLVESKLLFAHPMVFNDTCQLSLNFEYSDAKTRVQIPSIPAHREEFIEKTQDTEIVLNSKVFHREGCNR